jgi:hypothetical protein
VARRRPNLNAAIRALLEDVALRMPEFSHVQPSRILVVSGEARRASRGTVRPLAFLGGKRRDGHGRRKALVKVNGERMLYCITLRPLFFRDSSTRERVETLIHELFHISPKFDGTLDAARRHDRMGARFGRKLRPLVRRYLKICPHEVLSPFGYDGEVRIHQWLERPSANSKGDSRARRTYTEKQLFLASVRMKTRIRRKAPSPSVH